MDKCHFEENLEHGKNSFRKDAFCANDGCYISMTYGINDKTKNYFSDEKKLSTGRNNGKDTGME